MTRTVMVTGGAGFIGSALVRHLIAETDFTVVNVDCLTYAGNLQSLAAVADHPRHRLERVDVRDGRALARVFDTHRPAGVIHLAAETHVDRSIQGPTAFVDTNIVGTCTLLEAARSHWERLNTAGRRDFRFHHVSTDEVFGPLTGDALATEAFHYRPTSPYAASKAAADHLVNAWRLTYGLPTVVSNCSNNYGPWQYPEKLIPLMIINAVDGMPLPVYGDGRQVRDWLHVEDHARALALVFREGRIGESYNIGGDGERTNIEVVNAICDLLEELHPRRPDGLRSYRDLITHVADRPGHDVRYGIDARKIGRELGWRPRVAFGQGLRRTVQWYLENRHWWRRESRPGMRVAAVRTPAGRAAGGTR